MTRAKGIFASGVVEGFYGRPWSHSERLDMMRFLGENKFNVYVYAAKDDPHIRSNWRRTYPREYLRRIQELINAASRSSLDFVFTLNPGLDIVYSSKGEMRLLVERLGTMIDSGCGWVGVFLDDIGTELVHPADRAGFSSLAAAHVSLLNGALDELRKRGATRLSFCPTYYANAYLGKEIRENDYLDDIGNGLDHEIDILWTGRHVVSTTITEADVEQFEGVIRRKPFLWDNYPVNDFYRPGAKKDRPRMNMGPFRGRAPGILEHLAGYVSNPMIEPEASKIPLLTLADYLQDPSGYSPERSHERAVMRFLSDEKNLESIRLMIGSSMANPLDPNEVADLAEEVRRLAKAKNGPAREKMLEDLGTELETYLGLRRVLSASMKNRKLLSEFRPVLEKIHELAKLGLSCLDLERRSRTDIFSTEEARRSRAKIRAELKKVHRNRTQALGEVAFGKDLSDLGLPVVERESPIIELCHRAIGSVA